MAQHGYLREYDESWDRDDDRDRDDARRDRGFMFSDRNSRAGDRGRERFGERHFSSHQDDHYRSWRDRQMEELDRDYADYCREREQQFHSDFDSWRRNRGQQRQQPVEHGSVTEEVMELDNPRPDGAFDNGPSPLAEATLGTNNSENTAPGRR